MHKCTWSFLRSLITHEHTPRAQYGAPGDFDEWARIIGDDSWSSKNLRQWVSIYSFWQCAYWQLLRYFNKFETYTPHVDYPLVDLSARGKSGPIQVGYNSYVSKLSGAFINSCINIGIPFTPDFNGTLGTIGVGRVSDTCHFQGT